MQKLILLLALVYVAFSATFVWNTAVSADNFLASLLNFRIRQTDGSLIPALGFPGADDDVLIEASGSYSINIRSAVSYRSLVIGAANGVQTVTISAATTLSTALQVGANAVVTIVQGATVSGSAAVTVSGNLSINGALSTTGNIQINTGAVVTVAQGATVSGADAVTVAGNLVINGALSATSSVQINTGASAAIAAGATVSGSAAVTVAGNLVINGALSATGNIQINTGAAVTVAQGATVSGAAAVAVAGSLSINGALSATGGLQISSGASVTLSGSGSVSNGNVNNTGTFTVAAGATASLTSSFVNQARARLIVTGNVTVSANSYTAADNTSSVTINGGFNVQANGAINFGRSTVGGSGSISGQVTVNGRLGAGNSPGFLFINGDLTVDTFGEYYQEVQGITFPGRDYDRIVITGRATLKGRIVVDLQNNFQPAIGDAIDILLYNAVTPGFVANFITRNNGNALVLDRAYDVAYSGSACRITFKGTIFSAAERIQPLYFLFAIIAAAFALFM